MTATATAIALGSIPVKAAMHPGVISCAPDASARLVAATMATRRIHAVVVFGDSDVDAEGVWGVISDRDLLGADLKAPARLLAKTPALTIGPDEPLDAAVRLMVESQVTHLVVTDPEHGRPLGIVSTLDIARILAER